MRIQKRFSYELLLIRNEQYYCIHLNVPMCADISERESPGVETLLLRLCAALPELTYRSLRDILVSLTLFHAAAHQQQLATLDCLLDQELADKMDAKLDLSATQGGGGYRSGLWCSEFRVRSILLILVI
jgi:hypothetical protein